MATPGRPQVLRIRVLADSAPESGRFVVRVVCDDPVLLGFWRRKEPFHNAQVEQSDLLLRAVPGRGLEFVLRAKHRAPGLANSHYWGPFVLGLCLDALLFRFRFPPDIQDRGVQDVMEGSGELVLLR